VIDDTPSECAVTLLERGTVAGLVGFTEGAALATAWLDADGDPDPAGVAAEKLALIPPALLTRV
jgi:hypothetical protein